MKVLDATFLIDYLDDVDAAIEYVTAHATEEFIVPLPAYAEVLVGEGNQPGPADVAGMQNALGWIDIYEVGDRHAVIGTEIADEVGPEGPYLGGCDALIAAVGRELDAPVVTADRDLTHPETKAVVDIEEYRT
jgi:predicted nucleic acid-binding protein